MYALFVIGGENLVCRAIKADNVNRYLREAADLCKPRRITSSLINEFSSRSDWIKAVIKKQKRWERLSDRQEPMTNGMIEYCIDLAVGIKEDSLEAAIKDWLILGEYTIFRLSEWAQEQKNTKGGKFSLNDPSAGGDGSSKAFIV